jgi:iron-sulfur cluster assembly protein
MCPQDRKKNIMTKEECPVLITAEARRQFIASAANNPDPTDAIRIGVKGGGCSGFLYNLEFIAKDSIDPDEDVEYDVDGLIIVIDCFSKEYLANTTIDYLTTLSESGFKFRSGKVRRTCGCGSSFSD